MSYTRTPGLKGLYDHLDLVINKSWNYAHRFTVGSKDEVMNAILGLAGEAGETADIFKKYYHHTEKDWVEYYRGKFVYEMGDILFYWLKLLDIFGVTVEEVIAKNRAKLESRHPELGKVETRFGEGAIR